MINKDNAFGLAHRLKGINTLVMIERALGVNRAKAIYLVHKLRKKGYVKTTFQSDKTRVYYISPQNALKGTSYLNIINKYSPIKLAASNVHEIYGREPSSEETLIYSINQRTVRYIIASLSLFRKVRNWGELYKLAKEKGMVREVAALYDVARLFLPKLRKMPARFRNLAIPKKTDRYKYIISGFDSNDFKEIENKWKVYIPLNTSDLRDYKGRFS